MLTNNQDFSKRLGSLDAILMSGQSAHERFGGGPVYGTSQILSNDRRIAPIPPWIVTVPSLYIHEEDSSATFRLYYNTFQIIFRTVKQFNSRKRSESIQSLGIDLDYIPVGAHRAQEKAEGFSMAYLDCYPPKID